MKGSQKTGGYAALVQAAALVLSPIYFLVLLPGLGIDPASLPEPATIGPVINSPILYVGSLIDLLVAATVVVIALTLYDRYGTDAPNRMRWAVAAAVIASALFLSAGMLDFGSLRAFTRIPSQYQSNLLVTVRVVVDALHAAAIFSAGWSFLLIGWAALQTGGLPRVLSIIVILGGVFGVIAFIVTTLAPLRTIINLVWSIWLGVMLLREK